MTMTTIECMELAIEEAKKSVQEKDGRNHPKVGAVLTEEDGNFIATGHRGEARNGEHAEYTIIAKKTINRSIRGTTLYTTLEPCTMRNHPKKPCVDWIIDSGIKKVVIGMLDPNKKICGKGIIQLRKNGVEIGFFEAKFQPEIEEMNKEFTKQVNEENPTDADILPIEYPSEYENTRVTTASINDLSQSAIQSYLERTKKDYKYPSDELIEFFIKKRFLIRGEDNKIFPSVAGLLLFGDEPDTFLVQDIVKAIYYDGNNNDSKVLNRQDIKGNLFKIIEDSQQFFINNMKHSEKIVGFSKIKNSEYPYEVLKEAIQNAVVHRDYKISSSTIIINMFQDRITIDSPGLLVSPLTLENIRSLNYKAISRNPIISRTMSEMDYTDEIGSGIKKMNKGMSQRGLKKPEFNQKSGHFTVTFYSPGKKLIKENTKNPDIINMVDLEKLNLLTDRQIKIIKLIIKKSKITSNEIMIKFNIKKSAANEELKSLVKNDLIVKQGESGGTYYILKE